MRKIGQAIIGTRVLQYCNLLQKKNTIYEISYHAHLKISLGGNTYDENGIWPHAFGRIVLWLRLVRATIE